MRTAADRCALAAFAVLALLVPPTLEFDFLPQNDPAGGGPASCHLPSGTPAFCTRLSGCTHINALTQNLRNLTSDVASLILDSFFCPRNANGIREVCCPLQGIVPRPKTKPKVAPKDGCSLQRGGAAECVLYSACSPFVQLLVNLQRPFPPEVPDLMRSGWLCGLENSGGILLPKICCPKAALAQTPPHPFSSHPNIANVASPGKCGDSTTFGKIVGGQDAAIGQFPWLANLGYLISGNTEAQFKCGGALIGDRYVVTAAHCVTNLPGNFKLARVRVGEHKLSEEIDCWAKNNCAPKPQDFVPTKIIPHESYNAPNPFQHDIALLKLDRPVVRNDFVIPICLPFFDAAEEEYTVNQTSKTLNVVAGWGATTARGGRPADTLQYLTVDVFDDEKCGEVYKTRGGVITPGDQMCAGGEKGKDSCVGDSGSALMRDTEAAGPDSLPSWRIIGIVSFGPRFCGTEGIPGVYTRVRNYLQWVLDHAEP